MTLPDDATRALIAAVDPADAGRLAFALMDLPGTGNAGEGSETVFGIKPRRMALEMLVSIDALSTAEVLITAVKYDLSAPLTSEDRALAVELAEALEPDGLQACSVGPSEEVVIPDAEARAEVLFDTIAAGDGEMLDRVREAQQLVSDSVTPCNKTEQLSSWLQYPVTKVKKAVAVIGVELTRLVIKASTSLSMHGFGKDRISEEELGVARRARDENRIRKLPGERAGGGLHGYPLSGVQTDRRAGHTLP
jgi:hypothetical protein